VTVLEWEKIMTLSAGGSNSKEFHIWTIIEKAEDSEGKKVFEYDIYECPEELKGQLKIGDFCG
jgi:hypothetical protein